MSSQFDVIFEREGWCGRITDPTKIAIEGMSTSERKKPTLDEFFESILEEYKLKKIENYIILRIEKIIVDEGPLILFTFIDKEFYRES